MVVPWFSGRESQREKKKRKNDLKERRIREKRTLCFAILTASARRLRGRYKCKSHHLRTTPLQHRGCGRRNRSAGEPGAPAGLHRATFLTAGNRMTWDRSLQRETLGAAAHGDSKDSSSSPDADADSERQSIEKNFTSQSTTANEDTIAE